MTDSTALVNFNDNENFNKIAALTGASVSTSYLPRLRVNRHAEDDNDKPIPLGSFAVEQDDNVAYSKVALFRTFINAFQYTEYDPKAQKFVNRSVIIKNFNQEAIDEKGGVACGKLPRKEVENASEAVQLAQRNIKCTRILYGTVTFPEGGIDADGNKVAVENVPVTIKLNGGNFMAPNDSLKAIAAMKHHMFQHNLKLTTKKEKKGDNVYYSIQVSPVLNQTLDFTDEDMDTFNLFQENIDRENKYVESKFTEAKRGAVKSADDININDALGFDDDVSDL